LPAAQAWHVPLEQCWPLVQTLPHAPQLAESESVNTHASPHFVVPPPHSRLHVPLEHTSPG
jgi:hypothetical protein